jgi:outer membrane murein-binding lipoprotein Lpp
VSSGRFDLPKNSNEWKGDYQMKTQKRTLLSIPTKLGLALALLLATLTLAGCGIPQEDYDQVVSDLAAVQTEVTRLETELAAAQDENSSSQDELDAAQAEYDGLQAEYDGLQAEYDDLQAEYDDLQAACDGLQAEYDDLTAYLDEATEAFERGYVYHSIVVELILPAVTGDALTEAVTIDKVGYLVEEAEDEGLQERYEAWAKAPWNRGLAGELLWHSLVRFEEVVFEMGD